MCDSPLSLLSSLYSHQRASYSPPQPRPHCTTHTHEGQDVWCDSVAARMIDDTVSVVFMREDPDGRGNEIALHYRHPVDVLPLTLCTAGLD